MNYYFNEEYQDKRKQMNAEIFAFCDLSKPTDIKKLTDGYIVKNIIMPIHSIKKRAMPPLMENCADYIKMMFAFLNGKILMVIQECPKLSNIPTAKAIYFLMKICMGTVYLISKQAHVCITFQRNLTFKIWKLSRKLLFGLNLTTILKAIFLLWRAVIGLVRIPLLWQILQSL